MNKSEFNALVNDFFATQIDDVSNEEMDQVLTKYGLTVEDSILDQVTAEAERWVSNYTSNLANINQSNQERMISLLQASLVQKYNIVLGKDIKKRKNGLVEFVSPELLNRLAADFSPKIIDRMVAEGILREDSQNPYRLLEKDIGAPFFSSLKVLVKRRTDNIDDTHAIHYLNIILENISDRHPWLLFDQFPHRFLISVHGERLKRITKGVSVHTADFNENSCLFMAVEDVLAALGKPGLAYVPETGAMVIRTTHVSILEKVWPGEKIHREEFYSMQERPERNEYN
jgi:hypothetical protein